MLSVFSQDLVYTNKLAARNLKTDYNIPITTLLYVSHLAQNLRMPQEIVGHPNSTTAWQSAVQSKTYGYCWKLCCTATCELVFVLGTLLMKNQKSQTLVVHRY